MRRADLPELHYITGVANVASMVARGILSHRRAEKIAHESVAMQEVQDRRSPKVVPQGLPLHDYVNLYINARNPMMFKRHEDHARICVLRLHTDVLDIPGVVVTDMNAAKGIARFGEVQTGLRRLDRDLVFADDWRHPADPVAYERHRSIMCAEVLVPHRVDPGFIIGAYVSCTATHELLRQSAPELDVTINGHLFFR